MENTVIFELKSWWKYICWLLKNSCLELFGNGKYSLFLRQKVEMERLYLLITEKFLFWTFQEWEIQSFFEAKSWWKDDVYWLLKSSCFELFGDGKYSLLWGKKLMERRYLLIAEKFLFLVHELEPKKMGIWLRWVDKTIWSFTNLRVFLFLENCDELSEWVAFGQKLRYFTDQKGPKGGPHENEFWVFSNSEMNVTNI